MNQFACGVCGWANFDYLAPPILLWLLLSVSWFSSQVIVGHTFKVSKLLFQPDLGVGLLIVLFATGAFMVVGLPFFFLLMPFAVGVLLEVLFFRRSSDFPPKARRAILVVGVIHVIAVSFCAGLTHRILTTRTEAQYIVKWGHTAPGRVRFEQLQAREPQSLEQYRYIVLNGRRSWVTESAERIAAVSRDESDIALLETALRQNSFWMYDLQKDSLKKSLEQLKTRLRK